ncbi:MAG: hypothetical protein AAF997_07525 [Myxococcota bacterium]
MRILVALVLSGALMVVGCGDDSDNGTGGSGGSAGTGGSGGTGGSAGTGGSGGTGGSAGMGGSGGGGSDLTVEVLWGPVGPCNQGTPSDYEVQVVPMNQVGDITIVGSVSNCSGDITAEVNEINCPNNAPYLGAVTVTDMGGGMVTVDFTVEVCEDGTAP